MSSRTGKFHPPMGLTCAEEDSSRDRVKGKFRRTVTLGRSANITKPINGRAPCHYCGPCDRAVSPTPISIQPSTTVADALTTGNCTHIPNAMVYQVLMDTESESRQECTLH